MILHDRNTKLNLRRPHEDYVDLNLILMERKEYKHLVSSIIRLDFDSETEGWYLEFPKSGFLSYINPMKSDNKIAYWRKMFSHKYLHVEYLV
jgi:hypothetical protein